MMGIAGVCVLGLAFGFVLQRGGFCGSALLSRTILDKDLKGLVAILAAVLVSMVGFSTLAWFGWVVPNPSPLRLLSAVVGGLLFGVGMVLAGGCVTGTLYKAGTGRLTSILALVGIGLGATAASEGLLAPAKKAIVLATAGLPLLGGVDELVGLPYPVMAALVGGTGLTALAIMSFVMRDRSKPVLSISSRTMISKGWSPVTAGVLVGILGWLAYLSSAAAGRAYPLGATGGVNGVFSYLLSGSYSGPAWTIFLIGGLVAGSGISAVMQGDWKLRSADPATLVMALVGGLLVGVGVALGRGCFIGHNVSGIALLSLHSMIFATCTIAANWLTTFLYLRGLR